MNRAIGLAGACCILGVVVGGASAQSSQVMPAGFPQPRGSQCCPPVVLPDGCPPVVPGVPGMPEGRPPVTPEGQPAAPTPGEAFAQAPEAGTQPAASFNPGMFGDAGGAARRRGPTGQGTPVPGARPGDVLVVSGDRIHVDAPVLWRVSFKIAENESPRPVDRVFVTYNYYNDVDVFGFASKRDDLHREMVGFEKTFLNGNASVGMRVPFLQLAGSSDFVDSHVDDLSIILKYAFINNRETGNVLSGGLVVTAPTGERIRIVDGSSIASTYLQPWVGFIYNVNALYAEGFSSVAVPTDARDVMLFFNSLGVGYRAYRNGDGGAALREIVPQVEVHVNTPLNHRGLSTLPIGFPDDVDLTGGFYFVFRRAVAGIGAATPLTGPKPFEFEILANLNIRF
jgi:hypothetical protein